MRLSVFKVLILLFLIGMLNFVLFGQDIDPTRKARNIRAKKLAQNWREQTVTLILFDGSQERGKLVDVDFYGFKLDKNGSHKEVPIEKVRAVKLSPGFMEIVLTGFSSGIGAGLTLGAVTLTSPGVGICIKLTVGVIGAAFGTWFGYRTFYQEDVIELD